MVKYITNEILDEALNKIGKTLFIECFEFCNSREELTTKELNDYIGTLSGHGNLSKNQNFRIGRIQQIFGSGLQYEALRKIIGSTQKKHSKIDESLLKKAEEYLAYETHWLIPSNPKVYDIENAFNSKGFVYWNRSTKIKSGDIVYFYIAKPVQEIRYVARVVSLVSGPEREDDKELWLHDDDYLNSRKSMAVKLVLIGQVPAGQIGLDSLQEAGMKGRIQGPRKFKEPWGPIIIDLAGFSKSESDGSVDSDDLLINELAETDLSFLETIPLETILKTTAFKRDRRAALFALKKSQFRCEVNPEHETFKRRRDGYPYLEPHHLIPLSQQKLFNVSLDRPENIVCLCSHCHNKIHYGKDWDKLVKQLYEDRKELLEKIGIEISFEDLLSFY